MKLSIITVVNDSNFEQLISKLYQIKDTVCMNYEVILINSCMKNHIEIISKKLNTIIVNSKSQNLIENLKLGTNKCTGDYVWVVDLKDSLCDKIYEENISWQNSDIVVFGYKENGVIPDYIKHAQTKDNLLISHYNNLIYKLVEYKDNYVSNKTIIKTDFFINDTFLKNIQLINNINCKFYKKEIFKNIIYNFINFDYLYLLECKYSKSIYLCIKDLIIYNIKIEIYKKSIKNKINELKNNYIKLNRLFNDEENNIIDIDNIFSENIKKDLYQYKKHIKFYIKYLCKVFNQSLLLDAIYMYNNCNKLDIKYFNKLQKYCIKYCDHKFKLTIGIIYQDKNIDKLKKLLSKLEKYVKNNNEIILVNNSINKNRNDYKSFHKINHNVTQVFMNHDNKYPGYARNQIIQSANGDYVWFLDDDDDIPEKNIFYVPDIKNGLIGFGYNEIAKNKLSIPNNRTENILSGFYQENIFDYLGVLALWNKWIKLSILKTAIKSFPDNIPIAYNEDTIINLLVLCYSSNFHNIENLIYIKYPGISDVKLIYFSDFKKILIGYSIEKEIRNNFIKTNFYNIYYKYLSYYIEDVANKCYLQSRYNAVIDNEKWYAKNYAKGLGIECLN